MNRPTDPPNHLPIHLLKGGSVSTNHKSSNRIELSRLDQVLLKFLWFHIFWPTNPPIHPPKKHPPMGGEFSTDSKSFNGIEIAFLLIWGGTPWGMGGWVDGGGVRWGHHPHMCTCTCMHACACTCTHTCMHVKHDKHGCLHGGGHLQFPNMFILAFCACACVHMCVHMSRDTPPCPQMPPNPSASSPEP